MKVKHLTKQSTNEPDEKTQSQLASELGISRQVLSYHKKLPGSPRGMDLDEWRTYLEGQTGNMPTALTEADKKKFAKKKLELLSEQVRKAKRENDAGDKLQISKSFHVQLVNQGLGAVFTELDRMAIELPPDLAGRDPVTIESRILAEKVKISNNLKAAFAEWLKLAEVKTEPQENA